MRFFHFETIFSYIVSGSLACAILVIGLFAIYWQPAKAPAVAEEPWPRPLEIDERLLTARAAVVYDPMTERVLFAKNAEEVLPLASLTKLIAAQAVLARRVATTTVLITTGAVASSGDWGFLVGEYWPLEDLLRFALAASSNDAIAAAANTLGVNKIDIINSEAQNLGLTKTQVLNPTGLDESSELAGGYGSAHDIALLAAAFLQKYPTFFESTATQSISIKQGARLLTATSTALPLLDMPGLIGAKTGYTDLAGGNLVAAFDLELGRPIIIVALGSTLEGRFSDVKLLLEAVRKK